MNKIQRQILEEKFIALFDGDPVATARKAGAHDPEQMGRKLFQRPEIKKAIREREEKELRPGVVRRQERQKFWSEVMNDPMIKMADRLKASELLGRSEADFTENMKVDVNTALAEKMRAARERVRRIGEGSDERTGGAAAGQ